MSEQIVRPKKQRIKAILPWFGGKRTLAPIIVEELGKHSAYWEPFCGSMAVLLAKEPAAHEYVNDLHGDVVNLGNVLASDRWRELKERLERTLCAEHVFEFAKSACHKHDCKQPCPVFWRVTEEHLERAYLYVLYSWLGMNGFAGTMSNTSFSIRYTTTGGAQSRRFRTLVDSFNDFHERLRFVSITRRDGIDMLAKIHDAGDVAIYVDPPYLFSTRSKGGNRYLHEFTDECHRRLEEQLKRFVKARIVLSYYDAPELERRFEGWTVRRFSLNKQMAMHAHRGSKPKVSPEVLLLNGPSYCQSDALFSS